MKQIIRAVLGLLMLAAPAVMQAQFTYTTNADNTLTITAYTNAGAVVSIPSTINGRTVTIIGNGSSVFPNTISNVTIPDTVTAIGDYAFEDCYDMTSVTVPNSVISIGDYAFEDCESLPHFTIPNRLTSIGYETFDYCTNLSNIVFPDSVTSIGYESFDDCYSLRNVIIGPNVTSIDYYAFEDCGMTNLMIGTNGPTANGPCAIGYGAFSGCTNIETVVIGSSVTSIGYYAFEDSYMTNLTIGTNGYSPNGGCYIGEYAFDGCHGLTNVLIGNSVTALGYEAFEGSYMTNVTIGTNGLSPNGPCAVGYEAFESCYMGSVNIGNSVTSIGDYAFEDSYLTNLTIGTNGTSPNGGCAIGYEAFYDCYDLVNVVIGNSVTDIGAEAFYECHMTNVTIGNNRSNSNGGCTIDYEAFYDCTMTNLFIGSNVTSVGYEAFESCDYLSNAIVTSGSIADYAFEECSVVNLTLGSNVTSIGYEAFEDCSKLTNAIIGGGTIAEYAFEDCYNLTNLAFGPNVTSIGYEAFEDCGLRSLAIPDSVTSIGDYAFDDCYYLTNLTIGNGVPALGYEAFADCYDLTNVTFGSHVGSIGYDTFYDCTNLQGLYFQGNAPSVDTYAFQSDNNPHLTAYYYAGATGFGLQLEGIPTMQLAENSLEVTLGPTAARNAGAAWQFDGGNYVNAGVTLLYNLAAGGHTVTFTSIPGWIAPADQTITISNGAASVVGLYTPTNTPASGLVLLTNGFGTIHASLPKLLLIGKKYTVTAVPNLRNVFAFWAGGTSQPYAVLTSSAAYSFIMKSNLVLSATFVTNPFIAVSGTYNGLFNTTNGVTEATAGMLAGLTINSKGTYSGTLLISGGSHAITGSFNSSGQATNVIARPAAAGGPLRLEMTFMTSDNSAPEIVGSVFGTNNGVPWVADNLQADLATNAIPSAEYTMLILPDTNNAPPTSSPGGDGYLLITNNASTAKKPALAKVKITGALADGTAFTQTVPASQSGYVPIYANLYNKQGLLLGWINLDLDNTTGIGLTWIHPPATKGLYTNGFTNILFADHIPLSLWTNPPPGLDLLADLTTLPTTAATNTLTNIVVTTSASGAISGTSVTGSIDPKTGLMKVTIGSGASKVTGFGAVLLNATNAGGYFLTSSNAQAIEVAP